jgi:NAD(P)-dependent dehydrogenase (short-subunit alcohol dehydrogenase family)
LYARALPTNGAAVAAIAAVGGTGSVSGLEIDSADEASILAVVRQAASRGNLGGVVMSTSGASGKSLEDLTAEDFDRANRINLTGTFLLARAARPMGRAAASCSIRRCTGVAPVMANYRRRCRPTRSNMARQGRHRADGAVSRGAVKRNGIRSTPSCRGHSASGDGRGQSRIHRQFERAAMLGGSGRNTRRRADGVPAVASSYVTGHVLTVDGG